MTKDIFKYTMQLTNTSLFIKLLNKCYLFKNCLNFQFRGGMLAVKNWKRLAQNSFTAQESAKIA